MPLGTGLRVLLRRDVGTLPANSRFVEVAMPNVVDNRSVFQSIKKKASRTAKPGPLFRVVLANRKEAMEHVFSATHGRRMTEAERRRFEETGD